MNSLAKIGLRIRPLEPLIYCAFLNQSANISSNQSVLHYVRHQQEVQQSTNHIPSHYDRYVFPEPPRVVSNAEHDTVVEKVNECIAEHGKLFAVIQIASKQLKITDHDLIRTTGYLDAEIGDRVRLEKVLLVGGTDFSLIGRPIIRRSLVHIEAVIVEKTPGVVKLHQKFLRARNFEKRKLFTPLHTVLRINSIEVKPNLDKDHARTNDEDT